MTACAAAKGQSSVCVTDLYIEAASTWMRGPPSRLGVTNELADSVKTSSEPATMPGRASGSTTVRTACRKLQPMVRAASSRRQSRSEEHTSELQSLMRISYAVFCLTKKKTNESSNRTQQKGA